MTQYRSNTRIPEYESGRINSSMLKKKEVRLSIVLMVIIVILFGYIVVETGQKDEPKSK
jgi:hypothetical protein